MSSSIVTLGRNPRPSRGLRRGSPSSSARSAFTLVEMLIAMAITLVMIGAVVTLFANISNSVRNRRAVIEMSGQLRHARNVLQKDLQGATCNGLVWQRPDENQGYIEIIEGPHREGQASVLVDGTTNTTSGTNYNPEIDHRTSILPASNVPFADSTWLTDGGSLGDFDDILMLTVRNEHEPFVGRVPKMDGAPDSVRQVGSNVPREFRLWEPATIESPLAEVVWFAIENPDEDHNGNGFFGEPGMRTIYRRALLIAPWLNPYRTTNSTTGVVNDTFTSDGDTITAQPGLLRVLAENLDNGPGDDNDRRSAIASLIAYQERYDISARLEWDPLMGTDGRWKIVANTLGDLTKRENRYGHVGDGYDTSLSHFSRVYPFPMVSLGVGHTNTGVSLATDPELPPIPPPTSPPPPQIRAMISSSNNVFDFEVQEGGAGFVVPPFLYFGQNNPYHATARAILNDEGTIVRVVHGPTPLSGERKGEDVMLTDALGFDLRVYDPGAPLFAHSVTETVLEPTDPAWTAAYVSGDNMQTSGAGSIGNRNSAASVVFPFVGQGAYVDLGYGFDSRRLPSFPAELPVPKFATAFASSTVPWFFTARALSDIYGNQLAPGYSVFDTWSFHYENNGLNEDNDFDINGNPVIDEGTNGLDDPDPRIVNPPTAVNPGDFAGLGPDDVTERETVPPYDKPLRGVQVVLRLYERDSRQIRQVSVNQSFVPE